MPWEGVGDAVLLPCSDDKIPVDALAKALKNCTKESYLKKFVGIGDSMFSPMSERNNKFVGIMFVQNNSTTYDLEKLPKCHIHQHVRYLLNYDVRDAVHVFSFGLDAIRFNPSTPPKEIAVSIFRSLQYAAETLSGRGIDLWFLTIPEIGDLADKFREFNDLFRYGARKGYLKNVSLLDFSEMTLSRPELSSYERYRMLLEFFEQKYDMQLLKRSTLNPKKLVVKDRTIAQKIAKLFNRRSTV